MPGEIHDTHPFLDAEEFRDPTRRFRGRLSSPVTIVTAGSEATASGLTVSSLMVSGEVPANIHCVIGAESHLWDAISLSRRFIVHVVDASHRFMSDRFAGIRPSPGGPFAGIASKASPHGPVLCDLATRAYCTLAAADAGDDHVVVTGEIELVEVADLDEPLQWFRGSYRRLREQ